MKLLINTGTTYKGGSIQVAISFIEELKNILENEYHVILGKEISKLIDKSSYPTNFFFYDIDYRPANRVFSLKRSDAFFKKLEKHVKPDIVFTTSGPAYWRPDAIHVAGYNLAHYVYPESPFFNTISIYRRLKWKLKGYVIKYFYLRDVDVYVTQTDDINQRLRKWLRTDRVYTVSNTCNSSYFTPRIVPKKLKNREDNEFRLLLLSAYYHHKHIEVIIPVLEKLQQMGYNNIRFILTLPQDTYEEIIPEKYRAKVYNTGPVPIQECPSLFEECDVMFLPTLLECFSASYVEAMAMSKPVLTSDLGFALTVCQDAAIYFDPMDPHSIASKIIMINDQPALRQELILKGKDRLSFFPNARQRAESYLNICQKIINAQ